MDSLTQITLGAACGEVVLGKKIGNRAMIWGAIGGTIPDLDILGNAFLTDIEALAFHRGISHSLFFAVTTPFLFGWLTHRFYQSGIHQKNGYKIGAFGVWTILLMGFVYLLNFIPVVISGERSMLLLVSTLIVLLGAIYLLWKNYLKSPLEQVDATYKDWTTLFFWSIFTHPLLDAFTAYGTQLFAPFSDYRVAFNTISVVDPIYTVPFIICLLIASFIGRTKKLRRNFAYAGIALSSLYLLFTVYNKQRIDTVFEKALVAQNIDFQRFRTSPSIFNNILWQGVAEADNVFYMGMYSLFDKTPTVEFYPLEKGHELLTPYIAHKDIQTLQWFSDDYYNVFSLPDGKLQLSDVRFGSIAEKSFKPEDFVFRFIIDPQPSGLEITEVRERENMGGVFTTLIERLKGK